METNLQGAKNKSMNVSALTHALQALQLLEFLIKNGSERVIDDARSHLSLLKMLRQFHYIDQNGKDQGLNVRNRSKELADLLSDVDRIRNERKKARSNRNKFGGVEGGAMGGGLSSGSRYGGFGSEEAGFGGYSGGVYGDGGGFSGSASGFQDSGTSRRDRFEEYDENDENGSTPSLRKPDAASAPSSTRRDPKKAEPPKPKEPEIDFLSFDDDVPPETPPKELSFNGKRAAPMALDNGLASLQSGTAAGDDDDDFDEFQSATPTTTASSRPSIPGIISPSTTNTIAPKPMVSSQVGNLNSLAGANSVSPALSTTSSSIAPTTSTTSHAVSSPPAPNYNINLSSPPPQQTPFVSSQAQLQPQSQQPKSTSYQASAPNYFTSVPAPQPSLPFSSTQGVRPGVSSGNSFTASSTTASKPSTTGGSDAFGSLWSTASTSAGIKKSTAAASSGPNLASLQREKASQGIWGHSSVAPPAAQAPPSGRMGMGTGQGNGGGVGQRNGGGSGLDDLLG